MMHMCSSINELSSYIVISKHGARVRGCGERESDHAILANLLSPHTPLLQGLSLHILCAGHLLKDFLGE